MRTRPERLSPGPARSVSVSPLPLRRTLRGRASVPHVDQSVLAGILKPSAFSSFSVVLSTQTVRNDFDCFDAASPTHLEN